MLPTFRDCSQLANSQSGCAEGLIADPMTKRPNDDSLLAPFTILVHFVDSFPDGVVATCTATPKLCSIISLMLVKCRSDDMFAQRLSDVSRITL
jgi:hypothetical protein